MKGLKTSNRYIWVLANLLLLTAVGFFVVALFGKAGDGEANIGDFGTQSFNEDWTVYLDGQSELITLPQLRKFDGETVVVMEKRLPENVTEGMQLFLRSSLKDIRIYIGGSLREEYQCDDFWYTKENIPRAYIMVELTAEDAGQRVRIELGAEGTARLEEVRIGYGNNAWFELLESYLPAVIAAFLLVILGILAMLVQPVLSRFFHSGHTVFLLGQVLLVVGCWMLSESRIRQMVFHSPTYSTIFAYLCIETIGGFTVMYFNAVQKYQYNKIYCAYEAILFGLAAVNAVLDLSGLIDFNRTIIFSHCWLVVGVTMIITTVLLDYRKKRLKAYSVTAVGMAVFVGFCVAEAVNYYLSEFPVLGIYLGFGLVVLLAATVIQAVRDELAKIREAEALERAKEDAENANRAKSQFLARVSHEIRTPVNAVIGLNEMILRESREEETLQHAKDVKNASIALLDIINELLDASKIEAGVMELVIAEYELGSMLNDLYNMIRARLGDKQLKLVFDVDPNMPSRFAGDDMRIRQILLNLLTNAVKYTNEGTITVSLKWRDEGENAVLRYEVRDTGIGIKKEDIGKLKAAFQRVDLSRNKNVEGTGLGLNIVQQYLALMDSELEIQSVYEVGSEFAFEIEQKIMDREALGDFHERFCAAEKAAQKAVRYQATGAKVLVVDDHRMNLKVIRNLLKETGVQIKEAESGKECLEILHQQSFDLIFLDHMMPGMDGIETLHCIREEHLCDGVPIIMLTANATVGSREKYLAEGFSDFVSKPILPDQLDAVMLKYLPGALVQTLSSEVAKQECAASEDIKDAVMEQSGGPEDGTDGGNSTGTESNHNVEKMESDTGMDGTSVFEKIKEALPEFDYASALKTCMEDEEFYLELFQDFSVLPIREELARYLAEGDYKSYCIRIHGFKNNSYSIGARELGDLAYAMEQLTRETIPEEIEDMQKALLEEYDRICGIYSAII